MPKDYIFVNTDIFSGNGLLVITSTETSASSYYGETGLHYLSVKGEGCLVPRGESLHTLCYIVC